MNGLLQRYGAHIDEQPTRRMPAVAEPRHAQRVERLKQRADALGMDFDSYLDMLIEEDYMAYLRLLARGGGGR